MIKKMWGKQDKEGASPMMLNHLQKTVHLDKKSIVSVIKLVAGIILVGIFFGLFRDYMMWGR